MKNLIFRSMFLNSISNFRGIAIILIVAGHIYFAGFTGEDLGSSVIRNIITGGTSLFVFISGFMFHYIFYKRYEFKKFILNKIKNVGVPYFILATVSILLMLVTSHGYFEPVEEMDVEKYNSMYNSGVFMPGDSAIITIIKYYITGNMLICYWYIPFVLLLFLCAPFHIKYIELKLKYQLIIFVGMYLLSLFIHRPPKNLNPIHSVLYFTSIYLLGILVSMYSDNVKKFFNNKVIYLFSGIVLMSVIQFLYGGHQGNYAKSLWIYKGIDLLLIQKTFMVFFLYIILEKYVFDLKWLNLVSGTSFAIFFIHPWLIRVMVRLYIYLGIDPVKGDNNILLYFISLIIILLLSVLLALFVKKIFRNSKNTRYLIGY